MALLAKPRARSIAVERDDEGVRLALRALMEEGFQQAKIQRSPADRKRQEELLAALPGERKLAAGYYRWAFHLLRLDAERNAGIPLNSATLAAVEANGLRTLQLARAEHRAAHPACSRCGAEQEARNHPKCTNCGAEFLRKGGR